MKINSVTKIATHAIQIISFLLKDSKNKFVPLGSYILIPKIEAPVNNPKIKA